MLGTIIITKYSSLNDWRYGLEVMYYSLHLTEALMIFLPRSLHFIKQRDNCYP